MALTKKKKMLLGVLAGAVALFIAARKGVFGSKSGVKLAAKPAFLPIDFSSSGYLKFNTDVANSGMTAAQHYMQFGWSEGRKWR